MFVEAQKLQARRIFGGTKAEINQACNEGDQSSCAFMADDELVATLDACNAGDQSKCDELDLPGEHAVLVAHLPSLPPHAVPTVTAEPGLRLSGGAFDFTGTPPASYRMDRLAGCNANVSIGPTGDPIFVGDLMATPYYTSFGSGINFFDVTNPAAPCMLGGRPLSRNPESLPPPGGADLSPRGTARQYGVARGVAILPTEVGLEAYVAVEQLGLMLVNVGSDIPAVDPAARQLGPIYPGDYVDVAGYGATVLALNNNFGGLPSLDVISASLSPISSVSFEAFRGSYSRVHQLALAQNVLVRRGLPNGQVGVVRMSLAFISGANGITIVNVTDVEAPEVIGRVQTPGGLRTLALSKDAKMLLAGGDAGPTAPGVTKLYLIDVSSPFTPYFVDFDSDQVDDRIVFTTPYSPGVNGDVQGLEYDDARGLAYVASGKQLDIWALRRNAALAGNTAPIANAGPAATVNPDVTVTLDGSRSHDPDGGPITYQWQQVSGPAVTLTGDTTAQPTFSTEGLNDVPLAFRLVVSDGVLVSQPDVVTITVRRQTKLVLTPVLALVAVVPGGKALTATLEDVSGTSTVVTADPDTTYQWIGSGLTSGVNGIPNLTGIINDLTAKLGIPVQLANLTVGAAGVVTVTTPGVQLVRATHVVDGKTLRSNVSVVLAGIELDEISLQPVSAITTLTGALAEAVGSDLNPPLVLGSVASGYLLNTGFVALEDVTFKFAGTASIGVRDLLDAIKPAIAAALNALAPGGGTVLTPVLMGAFSVLAGYGGTQLLDSLESTDTAVASVTNQAPFKGFVGAVAPGLSAIKGTLDLGPLGTADDSVLVWVLPSIDSVAVAPNVTAIRETDPRTPGPSVRMYAESTAVAAAALPLTGKAQTAAELLDRFLPGGLTSWSAGIDRTFVVDTPVPGLKFRIRGGVTPGCSGPDASGEMTCTIGLSNVGLGFPVPTVFAPAIAASYTVGNAAVAQVGPSQMFDTHVIHQGVVGESSLTGTVSIPGLGSATDPTARVVVGRVKIVKQPKVPTSAAPPGSVVDFTITVTNPFADPAPGVTVVDTFYFRPPGATTRTVLSTQSFALGTLLPGQTKTIQTSVTIPGGPGAIANEAASAGSASSEVIITIDPLAPPAPRPLINEIVFGQQVDWDDSGTGGDGIPFNRVPGTNVAPHPSVNPGDHWFEIRTNTGSLAELSGWTITFAGAGGAPVTTTLSPSNLVFQPGSPYVVVVPPSGISAAAAVTLSDATGAVVDTVPLPAVFAAVGPATSPANESIARVPDGAPGSAVANFARRPGSIGGVNP